MSLVSHLDSTGKFGRSSSASSPSHAELSTGPKPAQPSKLTAIKQEEMLVLYPTVRALSTGINVRDNVPHIQSTLVSLDLEIASFFNQIGYADKIGFHTNLGGLLEHVALIDTLVEKGKDFVNMLYTYRTVSPALWPINMKELKKNDINENLTDGEKKRLIKVELEILRPLIAELKDLLDFINLATEKIRDCFQALVLMLENGTVMKAAAVPQSDKLTDDGSHGIGSSAESKHGAESSFNFHSHSRHVLAATHYDQVIVPELVYAALLRLLDCIIVIHTLKPVYDSSSSQSKPPKSTSSILVDVQKYLELLDKNENEPFNMEVQLLRDILNLDVYDSLRDEIKKVACHERPVVEMLNYIIEREDASPALYSTPDEKFCMARCLPYLLCILDSDHNSCFDVTSKCYNQSKLRDIASVQRMCKKYCLVPVIGDKYMDVLEVLELAANFKPSDDAFRKKWAEKGRGRSYRENFDLVTLWTDIRPHFEFFVTYFSFMMSRLQRAPFMKELNERTVDYSKEVFQTVKLGMAHLCSWTSLLKSVLAWKYKHPYSMEKLKARFGDSYSSLEGREYERSIRFNFTLEEKSTFVELVSMIKSLEGLISRAESTLAPIIRFHVHHRVQQLVQGDIIPILHRVDKRRNQSMSLLLQIRSIGADWLEGMEPLEDYKKYHRKSGPVYANHPARVVGPSDTQLALLRVLVRSLYDEKSHARHNTGLFGKSCIEKTELNTLTEFYEESYFYPALLNLSGTLKACCDLSFCWFREIQLKQSECVQFPIEMSLPWILTEHVITRKVHSAPMVENMLYTLDLYNDAAHCALHVLKRRHLYDEIEAEVSVVLEELLYVHSEEIYSYYKNAAASLCLDEQFKFRMEELKNRACLTVSKKRFEVILQQKHVMLLGRSINLSHLIRQALMAKLTTDIGLAIQKFEMSDVCCIVELETALKVLRQTHAQLAVHLELDSFNDIFNEVNYADGSSLRGRIGDHILQFLTEDIFGNFAYNSFTQRFVRGAIVVNRIPGIDPSSEKRKKKLVDAVFGTLCAKAYKSICELHKGFFGRIHMESIIALCPNEIPILVEECCSFLQKKLTKLGEVVDGLCQPEWLDNFVYDHPLPTTTIEAYQFFEKKLARLQVIDDLKLGGFQLFREIGNCIAFFKDFSACIDIHEQFQFIAVSPFLGLVPDTPKSKIASTIASSPLVSTVKAFSSAMDRSKDEHQLIVQKKKDGVVHQLLSLCEEAAAVAVPPETSGRIFHAVLSFAQKFITTSNLRKQWALSELDIDPAHTLYSVQLLRKSRFIHFWSSLSFMFNMRNPSANAGNPVASHDERDLFSEYNDMEVFGDGFSYAGCLIVHLLGQRSVFEMTDYSYEVLKLYAYENSLPESVAKEKLKDFPIDQKIAVFDFINDALGQKDAHNYLFALYESQVSAVAASSAMSGGNVDSSKMRTFHPPQTYAD